MCAHVLTASCVILIFRLSDARSRLGVVAEPLAAVGGHGQRCAAMARHTKAVRAQVPAPRLRVVGVVPPHHRPLLPVRVF